MITMRRRTPVKAPASAAKRKKRPAVEEFEEKLLEVGSEVMRKGGVVEVRESGREHVRGIVVRIDGRRATIVWGGDREETMSVRKAQTLADSFRRLPATHDFRRRRSTMQPANRATKKRRSSPEVELPVDDAQPPDELMPPPPEDAPMQPPEELAEPLPPPPEKLEDAPMQPPEELAEPLPLPPEKLEEPLPPEPVEPPLIDEPPPPPDDDTPQTVAHRTTKFCSAAVDELRHRHAEPEMKIEWHGGKGFGGSTQHWVNVGAGKFVDYKALHA